METGGSIASDAEGLHVLVDQLADLRPVQARVEVAVIPVPAPGARGDLGKEPHGWEILQCLRHRQHGFDGGEERAELGLELLPEPPVGQQEDALLDGIWRRGNAGVGEDHGDTAAEFVQGSDLGAEIL